MTALQVRWPTREGRWRKPAIVAASLGLHAVVLGYMAVDEFTERRRYGLNAPLDEAPATPTVYLDLRPRSATPTTESVRDAASASTDLDQPRAGAPTAPAPRFTSEVEAETAPPPGVRTAVWQAPPDTTGDRVERGLRASSLGCANAQFLSIVERDACDQRFGARAELAGPVRRSQPSTGEDGFARQAAANEAWRAYKEGEGAYPGLRSLFTER